MTDKVVQFEPFKNAKNWDKEYENFLSVINRELGNKNDSESLAKRLYFALRFLDGTSNAFWILAQFKLNSDNAETKRGKKFMIDWLKSILDKLKEGI